MVLLSLLALLFSHFFCIESQTSFSTRNDLRKNSEPGPTAKSKKTSIQKHAKEKDHGKLVRVSIFIQICLGIHRFRPCFKPWAILGSNWSTRFSREPPGRPQTLHVVDIVVDTMFVRFSHQQIKKVYCKTIYSLHYCLQRSLTIFLTLDPLML